MRRLPVLNRHPNDRWGILAECAFSIHNLICISPISLIWIEVKKRRTRKPQLVELTLKDMSLMYPLGMFVVSLYRFRYLFHSILFPTPAFHSHKLALL